jgi:hypothetical protein
MIYKKIKIGLVCAISIAGMTVQADDNDEAVERARETVRMLDDIYKTAVVLITDVYIEDEDSFPAGKAAKALFRGVHKKGWPKTRIIDVSGEPYNDNNIAKDAFEKQAIKILKQGKASFDKVEKTDEGRVLRAATAVPIVHKKCVLCHENYKKTEEGAAVGALIYTVKLK